MTLIEITIAIAIAVVLFAAVSMGIGAVTGARAKKTAGELSATIRTLYDEAALSGRTCRLVFTLPDERDENGKVTYRAECASGATTSSRDREEELRDATKAARDAEGGKKSNRVAEEITQLREPTDYSLNDLPSLDSILAEEKTRVDDASKYSEYTSPALEPVEIPPSVKISVWTKNQKKPVTSGIAYLYFYPQGYTERAMVFVEQGNNAWTIKVSPLTGKTEVTGEKEKVPGS